MTDQYAKEQVLKIYPHAKAYDPKRKNSTQVILFDEDNPHNGLWTYNKDSIWIDAWEYIQRQMIEKLSK